MTIRFACLICGFLFIATTIFAEDNYKVYFHSTRDEIIEEADYEYYDYISGFFRLIADNSKKSEIYRMNTDGTEQERITFNSDIEQELSFTDEKIVYVINEMDNKDIAWMDYEGEDEEFLCEDPSLFEYSYAIDSNFKGMVFTSIESESMNVLDSKFGDKELYFLDVVEMNQSRLTNNNTEDSNPSFFPDENKIIFMRVYRQQHTGKSRDIKIYTSEGYKFLKYDGIFNYFGLYTLDLDTMEEQPFSIKYNFNSRPIVSPDGNYIASSVEKSEYFTNFVLFDKDGNLLFEIPGTKDIENCNSSKFSIESKSIGVLCSGYDKSNLYIVDIEKDFSFVKINPDKFYVTSFDFSPDAKTVYFSAINGNFRSGIWSKDPDDTYKLEIYKIDTDGERLERLTDNEYEDYDVVIYAQP